MDDFIREIKAEIIKEDKAVNGQLLYRMLKSEGRMEYGADKVYGIQVTSRLYGSAESAALIDISTNRGYVEDIYRIAVDYNVLPAALKDIVTEYMETAVPAS